MTTNESALVPFDLGTDYSGGPHGVDRSLLAHCLTIANPDGWALEFGVGSGETLKMIAERLPAIGFDSFQGLPETWRPGFPKGMFAVKKVPEVPGTTVVQGWFEDTVPGYDWPDHVSLVHIDCDLYSSTATVLTELANYLKPGVVMVFDEFFGYIGCEDHEQRAWAEFVAKSGIAYEVIGHGREQWAVRVTA